MFRVSHLAGITTELLVGKARNIVGAKPYFPSVAAKLRDPAYRGWFLPFKPGIATFSQPIT